MSSPQFSSKMLETLKRTWLLYESITYSTTVFWSICLEKANFANFVSHPLGENLLKDLFWQKWWILKALKLQKLENANFAHFVSRSLGEKLVKHLFWQKWWILKTLKLQKLEYANFAHFVSRSLGEKLLKHIFWQKWGILKVLKLQKLKNASRPLGEKLPKDLFWQNWRLLKALKQKLENAKFVHLVSFPLWWKTTKTPVWTKLESFQNFEAAASNIWKGNLYPFCKPLIGEKTT